MAGRGWRMLVECLSGRCITLPSSAAGVKSVSLATVRMHVFVASSVCL